jgi:hypothetical protein
VGAEEVRLLGDSVDGVDATEDELGVGDPPDEDEHALTVNTAPTSNAMKELRRWFMSELPLSTAKPLR